MGGDLVSDERSEFLSRLLGKNVDWWQDLKLTSGQKARYFAWCAANDFEYQLGSGSERQSLDSPAIAAHAVINSDPYQAVNGNAALLAGIGIDIQQISELFPQELSSPKSDETLTAIFSLKELSYAEGSDDARQTLTGIFAAKEAIIKACPDYATSELPEIEVLPNSAGAPNHEGFLISISHSGDNCVAVAIFSAATTQAEDPSMTDIAKSPSRGAMAAPSLHKTMRIRSRALWGLVKNAALFLGAIGGIWVLIDKAGLFG